MWETWLPPSVMAESPRPSAPAWPSRPSCLSSKVSLALHSLIRYTFSSREFKFTSFSVHGSIWSSDGEFWARKGIGRVRLEPAANLSVDILVSSLCAEDTNSYYRQIQAQEFGEALRSSDADFVLGTFVVVIIL